VTYGVPLPIILENVLEDLLREIAHKPAEAAELKERSCE
jgi:hypothetical protein